MKNWNLLFIAVLLAIGISTIAAAAPGETYRTERQSIAAIAPTLGVNRSEELADLANDLARTAARLAMVQKDQQATLQRKASSTRQTYQSFSDVEAANQFASESISRGAEGTTVQWLVSDSNLSGRSRFDQVELPRVVGVSSGPSKQGSTIRATNRPAQPLRHLPTIETASTNSQVVHAQGSEEIFYTAQALQGEAEEIAPQLTDAPEANSPNEGSRADLGQATVSFDTCCSSGASCRRCRPPRRRIIVAGTEAVFLNPDINGNRSSFLFENFTVPSSYNYAPGSSFAKNADLDDLYIAPRLWLGIQGECWGVVGRYFHLRAGENDYDPFIPAARDINLLPITPVDEGFDVSSVFEAYYTDLELTRNFYHHGSKNQFTFGVRYALIEQNESVIAMAEVPQGLINGGARSNRQAHGTGLTFGLNGRKPLFRNSCANWFYNVRSSILWGNATNSVETWSESILIDPTATAVAGSKDGAIAEVNDDLFIGEVQLGLEWNFAMRSLPAKSFFRLAFEYQYWDASTGGAASGSFSGFEVASVGTSQGTASASAPGLRVDMLGFSVGTGFTW